MYKLFVNDKLHGTDQNMSNIIEAIQCLEKSFPNNNFIYRVEHEKPLWVDKNGTEYSKEQVSTPHLHNLCKYLACGRGNVSGDTINAIFAEARERNLQITATPDEILDTYYIAAMSHACTDDVEEDEEDINDLLDDDDDEDDNDNLSIFVFEVI